VMFLPVTHPGVEQKAVECPSAGTSVCFLWTCDGTSHAGAGQRLDRDFASTGNCAVTASATRVDLPADILFDYDKADILPNAAELLGSSRNPA
jgi:hypothetical protein